MLDFITPDSQRTLKHVIVPGGIRLHTWLINGSSDKGVKVGYNIYPNKSTKPIFSGYCVCKHPDVLHLESSVLNLLGTIFYANWGSNVFENDINNAKEYTEGQVAWLSGDEIDPILNLLDNFEEEIFDNSSAEERGYYWKNNKIYDMTTHKPLIIDVNLN